MSYRSTHPSTIFSNEPGYEVIGSRSAHQSVAYSPYGEEVLYDSWDASNQQSMMDDRAKNENKAQSRPTPYRSTRQSTNQNENSKTQSRLESYRSARQSKVDSKSTRQSKVDCEKNKARSRAASYKANQQSMSDGQHTNAQSSTTSYKSNHQSTIGGLNMEDGESNSWQSSNALNRQSSGPQFKNEYQSRPTSYKSTRPSTNNHQLIDNDKVQSRAISYFGDVPYPEDINEIEMEQEKRYYSLDDVENINTLDTKISSVNSGSKDVSRISFGNKVLPPSPEDSRFVTLEVRSDLHTEALDKFLVGGWDSITLQIPPEVHTILQNIRSSIDSTPGSDSQNSMSNRVEVQHVNNRSNSNSRRSSFDDHEFDNPSLSNGDENMANIRISFPNSTSAHDAMDGQSQEAQEAEDRKISVGLRFNVEDIEH
jgi:hypothetical protein